MSHLPSHVLLMPDGDRRFARSHHMTHREVYRCAAVRVQRFVCIAIAEYGIKIVSVFGTRPATFSAEVQKRGRTNLLAIFDALVYLAESLPELLELEVRPVSFVAVGSPDPPDRIVRDRALLRAWREAWSALRRLEGKSSTGRDSNDTGHRVNLLFNYSGRAALEQLLVAAAGSATPGPRELDSALPAELGGPVGLVVRTAGAVRMSDGPCHQFYDADFVQTPRMFPDLQDQDIRNCLTPFFVSDRKQLRVSHERSQHA